MLQVREDWRISVSGYLNTVSFKHWPAGQQAYGPGWLDWQPS
jgi:hypothetical protein